MKIRDMSEQELTTLGFQIIGEQLRRNNLSLFHLVAKDYQNGKIQAIKTLRGVTGKGLLESKTIVEYWAECDRWNAVPRTETFTVVENKTFHW